MDGQGHFTVFLLPQGGKYGRINRKKGGVRYGDHRLVYPYPLLPFQVSLLRFLFRPPAGGERPGALHGRGDRQPAPLGRGGSCARADTLYFGGGTPSLLGGRRLGAILRAAEESFSLFSADRPEITLEANPADDLQDTLAAFAAAGGNRLSLGMQSAVPTELAALGRRHTPADVVRTVQDAHRAGLTNISLDIMLGISGQTVQTVRQSVDCAAALGAQHASAYLLRVEPDTPYGHCPPPLPG